MGEFGTKYLREGDSKTWTNSTGSAVVAGQVVDTGDRAGVAKVNIANTATGEVIAAGVVRLAKPNNQAFADGARLFWDAGNSRLTTTAAVGSLFVGFAFGASAETATEGACLLAPYSEQGVRQLSLADAATLTAQDFSGGGVYLVTNTTADAFAVTLPLAASIGGGKDLNVRNSAGTNAVTLTRSGTDTIGGGTTFATIDAVNDRATFVSEVGLGYSLIASTIA